MDEVARQTPTKTVYKWLWPILLVALAIRIWVAADRVSFPPPTVGVQTFMATITAEPEPRSANTRLILQPQNESWQVVVFVAPYPEWQYGEQVEVSGQLVAPSNFDTGGGQTFDYIHYLAKDGIAYELHYPKITHQADPGFSWLGFLFKIKHILVSAIGRILPEPEAGLLGGLLLGDKSSLDPKLTDAFRAVGLSHVVVLSGYNITIVADSLLRLFAFLPRALGLGFGAVGIILFSFMAGGGATTARAASMSLIALIARATGRTYDAARALVAAIILITFYNPLIPLYDKGFHLSVLATLGLLYVAPLVERRLSWLPERFGFRQLVATTLGAELTVLPYIMQMTSIVPLLSLPANLLVVPSVPPTMLFGFVAAVLGTMSSILAWPITLVAHFLLWYQVFIVRLFSSLPFATFTTPTIPVALVWIWYGFFAWLIYRAYKKDHVVTN